MISSKFILTGILLLLTLVFGVWLSLAGKPYNGILFNIHKLVALGMVIFASIGIYQALKNTNPQGLVIVLLILAGICVVALFTTGAMMSIGTPNYPLILSFHSITIVILVLVLAGIVPLIMQGRSI